MSYVFVETLDFWTFLPSPKIQNDDQENEVENFFRRLGNPKIPINKKTAIQSVFPEETRKFWLKQSLKMTPKYLKICKISTIQTFFRNSDFFSD